MTAAAQTLARGTATRSSRSALLRSPETVRLYAADWAAFATWCRARDQTMLPADAATIAAYLQSSTDTLSIGALSRRLAAIADQHRQQDQPSATRDPLVKAVLRAARSTRRLKRRLAPTAARLLRMAAACPGDLSGLRDRALLLLLAAGGIGRAGLVGLDAEHIDFDNTGVTLRLRDRPGDGLRSIHLARVTDRRLDPQATEADAPLLPPHTDWLHHRVTISGPDDALAAFQDSAAGAGQEVSLGYGDELPRAATS